MVKSIVKGKGNQWREADIWAIRVSLYGNCILKIWSDKGMDYLPVPAKIKFNFAGLNNKYCLFAWVKSNATSG